MLQPGSCTILVVNDYGYGAFMPERISLLSEAPDGFSLISACATDGQKHWKVRLSVSCLLRQEGHIHVIQGRIYQDDARDEEHTNT